MRGDISSLEPSCDQRPYHLGHDRIPTCHAGRRHKHKMIWRFQCHPLKIHVSHCPRSPRSCSSHASHTSCQTSPMRAIEMPKTEDRFKSNLKLQAESSTGRRGLITLHVKGKEKEFFLSWNQIYLIGPASFKSPCKLGEPSQNTRAVGFYFSSRAAVRAIAKHVFRLRASHFGYHAVDQWTRTSSCD